MALMKRVQKVNRRNSVLEALEIEAEEIKDHGNIIAYGKQAKKKAPNRLSEEQVDNLSIELENRRTQLNDTCRTAHYSQEGVDQLLFRMESAKKLLLGINERYPEYQNSQKLTNPI